MAKTTECLLPDVACYSPVDYDALLAYFAQVPHARIMELYYGADSRASRMGLPSFLDELLDTLVDRAAQFDPTWRETIQFARQSGAITAQLLNDLVRIARLPSTPPSPGDQISMWFRPLMVSIFLSEGLHTLGDLTTLIAARGPSWWRSIPRIGRGRAMVIAQWLERHVEFLGELPLRAEDVQRDSAPVVLDPASPQLLPLGSFSLPPSLDGHDGVNRGIDFCFITADHDLAALDCYLAKYLQQPHTLRAYRRELERLVLWSVLVAKKPLSSLLVDDCQAYVGFLANPSTEFRGNKAPRSSKQWRPFSQEALDPTSVKFALNILRSTFDYLVKVRYLGGNPWTAVADPVVAQAADLLQIHKALNEDAWNGLVAVLERRSQLPSNTQDRVALAVILLMGDSGLRRNEVACAKRIKLAPYTLQANKQGKGKNRSPSLTVWMLSVLGKRSKWRNVPVSDRTIAALRAHWTDLGVDFDGGHDFPLVSPVLIPGTDAARAKHTSIDPQGYSGSALYDVVKAALARVQRDLHRNETADDLPDIGIDDIEQFGTTSPHAFRHTFGTLAVRNMPVTVVQEILGHEDSATTSIYVREKQDRIADESARYYATLQSQKP